jgi:phi LC3 family holin
MINWKVRFKNKAFWIGLIPLLLLLIQQVAAIFGISLNFGVLQEQLIAVIGTVFALLALLGVVVDPTTEGVGDSERALGYEVPYPKHAKVDE